MSEEDYSITSSFTFYSSPSQECIEIILHNDDSLEGLHSFSVNLNEQPLNISTSGFTDILIADANDGMWVFIRSVIVMEHVHGQELLIDGRFLFFL